MNTTRIVDIEGRGGSGVEGQRYGVGTEPKCHRIEDCCGRTVDGERNVSGRAVGFRTHQSDRITEQAVRIFEIDKDRRRVVADTVDRQDIAVGPLYGHRVAHSVNVNAFQFIHTRADLVQFCP